MQLFVKRDLDGFFGLFVDNLVQLLLIILLCGGLCGMTGENADFLYRIILPGAAVSILLGNVFYAWQAHRLARREGREDVTALPYGINTPSLIVFVFFIIKPEFDRTGSVEAAWKLGLLACLGSGLIEFCGAFVAERIRRGTPRAALLSTLAGIAIGFISMTFALEIFQKPLIALLPLALILLTLFSGVGLPWGLPGGFVAVLTGTLIAWLLAGVHALLAASPEWARQVPGWVTYGHANINEVQAAIGEIRWSPPVWSGEAVLEAARSVESWLPFLSVVVPMGLFNVIGSLQNIESAEASGDRYSTAPSLAVNGLGTILAAGFGSCFPTTIYIGHPGWKGLGARAGYSTLNGIVIVGLAVFGLVGLMASIVPIEAGAAIVLWIGIIITAQAFQSTPDKHGPAVAIGLFPAIAAWGATVMMGTVFVSEGLTLQEIVQPPQAAEATSPGSPESPAMESVPSVEMTDDKSSPLGPSAPLPDHMQRPEAKVNGVLVHGLLLMERGYIFTCMILAAACACLIDRKFVAAAGWMLSASVFTWLGLMHAYQVYFGNAFDYLFRFVPPVEGAYHYRADDIALGYLLCALLFLAISRYDERIAPVNENR
jgi:adenine/guanine/hypoxanthine permease